MTVGEQIIGAFAVAPTLILASPGLAQSDEQSQYVAKYAPSGIEGCVSAFRPLSGSGVWLVLRGRVSMPLSARPLRSIALMLILFACPAVIAQDGSTEDSNPMYEVEQYARCAAFFGVALEALARLGEHKTALTYQEYQYGAALYSIGSALEQSDEDEASEIVGSLIASHERQMLEVLDGKDENVAILVDRYHQECVKIVRETP